MSNRTSETITAFETTLAGVLDATSMSMALVSTEGLGADDGYLVIEPEDAGQREVIRYSTVSHPTVTITERYLTGSAAGSGLTHPSGKTVRMTPVGQLFEDLHDRVDAALGADISDHGGLSGLGDDDHTQYYNSTRHTKAIHDALGIAPAAHLHNADDAGLLINTYLSTADQNISTSRASVANAAITVPADWNTYLLRAEFTATVADNGASSNALLTVDAERVAATAMSPVNWNEDLDIATEDDTETVRYEFISTGQTSTGVITVNVFAALSAENNLFKFNRRLLVVTAYRQS